MILKRFLFMLLIFSVLVFSGCTNNNLVGTAAPYFNLSDLAGQKVSLADFRGHPIVVNFWQLSCPPCVQELPHFQEVYSSNPNAIILTIAIGNSSTLSNFVSENNYGFPVLPDIDGAVAASYGVRYTPTTFLIDSTGRITDVKIGPYASPSELEQAINSLN
jgi:peroxiredoxin